MSLLPEARRDVFLQKYVKLNLDGKFSYSSTCHEHHRIAFIELESKIIFIVCFSSVVFTILRGELQKGKLSFFGMELFHWAAVFLAGFSVLVLQTESQGE